ncbi:MAG: hypothetical protein RBS11_09215 [Sulfurimonas sp.]|nr:hypothetical protein [Sulfurimonas sp.]
MPNFTEPVSATFITASIAVIFITIAIAIVFVKVGKKSRNPES